MNKFLAFCSLLSLTIILVAQTKPTKPATSAGTNIKLTVKGLEKSEMILAFYSGDKQYVKDTVVSDAKGLFHIKADTLLPGGIYLAVFPKLGNRYFELIISENNFQMETDSAELAGKMKVMNSLENQLFYDDMLFLNKMRKQSDSISTLLKAAENDAAKEGFRNQLKKIDTDVKSKREGIMRDHPTLFYARLIKAMKEPEVPEFPRDEKGNIIDSAFQWKYYKSHYWDNIDLNDDRMLRTPIFHNKLKQYFTKTVVQIPDSLIVACDELLSKSDPKSDIYKYMLVYFLNNMANAKLMGMDAVYVHLVKNYYARGYATWVDSAQLSKIIERGFILEPLLIGKKAQNFSLADTTLKKFHTLHNLPNKYVVLCFWDPDCGHCKKEIPVLLEAYHNLKKAGVDVEVVAPAIMGKEHIDKWTSFIREKGLDWINVADPYRQNNFRYEWDIQSTPQIYVLDKNKVIKAKRIGADQIEDFILHEENPNHKPKKVYTESEDQRSAEPH